MESVHVFTGNTGSFFQFQFYILIFILLERAGLARSVPLDSGSAFYLLVPLAPAFRQLGKRIGTRLQSRECKLYLDRSRMSVITHVSFANLLCIWYDIVSMHL